MRILVNHRVLLCVGAAASLSFGACAPSFSADDGRSGAGGASAAAGSSQLLAGTAPRADGGRDQAGNGTVSGHGGSTPSSAGGGSSGPRVATGGSEARGGAGVTSGAGSTSGGDALGGNGGRGTGGTAMGGDNATGGSAGDTALGAGKAGTGGAGGAPSGGAAAGGRAGAAGSSTFCKSPLMIDDMEDGDDLTCLSQGRNGEWWTATGTLTGSIDPPTDGRFPMFLLGADARPGSARAARFSGRGFGHTEDDWASVGFYLVQDPSFDLTAYQGLAFYAKTTGGPLEIHVEFATDTTTPESDGGSCPTNCNDHYTGIVELDDSWQELSVAFDELAQEGWGPQPKDLAHTRFVYFGFLGTDGGPADFEFLIDDVRLY